MKRTLLILIIASLTSVSAGQAKTFDIGSGTVELPDDFVEVYSPPHEPFSRGFASEQRGLFIGWIVNGHSDAPPQKRIERPLFHETGTANGLSYRPAVSKVWDTRVVIVFSNAPKRVSFWSDVRSQKDLELVKSLILTFKPKLNP